MRSGGRKAAVLVVVLFGLVAATIVSAVEIPAKPDRYVVDLAGIVDKTTEKRLNGYLQELEQKTTAQLVVLTLKSLEGRAIEDLSLEIAHDRWRLGQKGRDNGVLFLIALADRKYRIEVGYGLEGLIPDSLAGSLGRQVLVPYFKKGDYAAGIYSTALVLASRIAADAGVEITGMPKVRYGARSNGPRKKAGPFQTIAGLLILVILAGLFIKNPRLFLLLFFLSGMGGRRGGWGGGGGFGGGGFGSFGGGGGGGFGGGGASGGW